MKTLYIDCSMGVSEAALAGALLDLIPDQTVFLGELNALGIPGLDYSADRNANPGVMGTRFSLSAYGAQGNGALRDLHEYAQKNDLMDELEGFLAQFSVPEMVKKDVLSVFNLLSEAEHAAYGENFTEHSFREVDLPDAVAYVISVCILIHKFNPGQILVSPVPVGGGTVRTSCGILPVPTPATAYILRDVPVCCGQDTAQRCTPIGAALLKHYAADFRNLPAMKISRIGYGIGMEAECHSGFVRVMLGSAESGSDSVLELSCNVDDMTGEEIGFALEQFLEAGALDAYTQAIGMKKSRPAVKVCVLCRRENKESMVSLMFRHTTTLGIREAKYKRYTLQREIRYVETPYGMVRRKDSSGYGVTRSKYEYEDLAKIANENHLSIDEVLAEIRSS